MEAVGAAAGAGLGGGRRSRQRSWDVLPLEVGSCGTRPRPCLALPFLARAEAVSLEPMVFWRSGFPAVSPRLDLARGHPGSLCCALLSADALCLVRCFEAIVPRALVVRRCRAR